MTDNSKIEFSEHPEYAKRSSEWTKYKDLYEGEHSVLSTNFLYLWPHELEKRNQGGDQLRKIRELRSRYMNLMRPVVSRLVSFLFRGEISVPEEVKKLYGDHYEDVTGTGVSFQSFWKDHFGRDYVLYGKARVLVDSSDVQTRTVREAKIAGKRPYLELLHPLEVKDWQAASEGRNGQYDFITIESKVIEPRVNARSKPVEAVYCRELAVEGAKYCIRKYKQKKSANSTEWQLVDEKIIDNLSEVPVVAIESGESSVKDTAEQQLVLFNLMSAESCILNASAFQKIFCIGVTAEQAKLAFGEYVVNFLPEGASVTTVEPSSTTAISEAVLSTIDRLFKVTFNQINTLAANSKESPSAESQREAKEDFIALIKSYIEEIETAINATNKYWAMVQGNPNFDAKVELNKAITLDDVDRELAIFNAHKDDFKKLATAYKEIVKKRVRELNLPNQETIDGEIDSTDFNSTPESQNINGTTKSRLLDQVVGVPDVTK